MQVQDTEIRLLEEELREFWPEWHVVRRIHEGGFAKVYEIRKKEQGLDFSAALKVIRHIEEDSTLLFLSTPAGGGNPHSGGEASTLQAGSPGLNRETSRKSLRQDAGEEEQMPDLFKNEIRIMNALRGAPNVVNMEGVHYRRTGREHILYIRMELLTSLASFLEAGKAFTLREILGIGRDVCRALICCEDRKIIHRDIKPGNLFLDRYGTCKVGDFGASRKLETIHPARVMTGIGTISYMAPEIYRGEAYNNTVDLYSLGLVLYQLLNGGRMPFMQTGQRESSTSEIDECNYKRLHGAEIPPLLFGDRSRDGQPPAAGTLDAVIRRACAYRPEDRYQTAEDLYKALEEYSRIAERAEDQEKTTRIAGMAGHRQASLAPAPPLPEEADSRTERYSDSEAGEADSRTERYSDPEPGEADRDREVPPPVPAGAPGGNGRGNSRGPAVFIFAASVLVLAAVILLIWRGPSGGDTKTGTSTGAAPASGSDAGSDSAAETLSESESDSDSESGEVQETTASEDAPADQTEASEQESSSGTGDGALTPPETETGSETGTETESETGSEPESTVEPETEPEPESEQVVNLWPDGALEYNGHHYYIYDDGKISWEEAVQMCLDRGGYPAVINDAFENEELYLYMRQSGYDTAFFGLTLAEDGQWIYSRGDTSDYRDWGINSKGVEEPNNSGGGETNVELDVHMAERGHWNDAAFGAQVRTPEGKKYKDRYTYICEWGE